MQFQTKTLPTDLTSPCQGTVLHTDSIIKHLNKTMQRKQQNVTINYQKWLKNSYDRFQQWFYKTNNNRDSLKNISNSRWHHGTQDLHTHYIYSAPFSCGALWKFFSDNGITVTSRIKIHNPPQDINTVSTNNNKQYNPHSLATIWNATSICIHTILLSSNPQRKV